MSRFSYILQGALFALLVLLFLYISWLVATVHGDFGAFGHKMSDADFTNIYAAGLMAKQGHLAAAYSVDSYQAVKASLLGRVPERADWVYPPVILPLGAIFSSLPLSTSFWAWTGVSLVVMTILLRRGGLGWGVVALTIVSPAEWRCLCLGQLSGVLSCAMFAGLLASATNSVRAGLLLGVQVLKPQMGLIGPVILLASRQWRSLLAGGLLVVLLCLLPVLEFGRESWTLYFTTGGALARGLLLAPFGQSYQLNGLSVFWMLRSLGGSVPIAYAAQGVAAAGAIALAWRVWRYPVVDPYNRAALTLLLSLYLTPYGYSSDMVGYTLALVVLAARRGWRVSLLDGVLWLWPGFIVLSTALTGVLLTPLVVGVAAFRAWRAVRL